MSDQPLPTIILAHGLWMTGFELGFLKRGLAKRGYHVVTFRYRMVSRSLDYNRRRLRIAILCAARSGPHAPVHLVGHSLGGVLALHTLKRFPELPVDKVVCLGSPLVDTSAGRVLHDYAAGRALLGKTLPQAIFREPLREWNGPQPVGVIAGTRGFGLGQYIGDLARPNDGVVALAETRLPGITDSCEFPVGHTRLVMHEPVVEQCDYFLRNGEFS